MTRFPRIGGRVVLDLCNTRARDELLIDPDDLAEWLREAGLPCPARISGGDLAEVRELRERLRHALLATDPDGLAEVAGAWLATAPGRLVVDRITLRTAFQPVDATIRGALVPLLEDALDLARATPGRVRECAADGCHALYADTSRNHSRRWCSMERCGARAKAHAYYQRRRGLAS